MQNNANNNQAPNNLNNNEPVQDRGTVSRVLQGTGIVVGLAAAQSYMTSKCFPEGSEAEMVFTAAGAINTALSITCFAGAELTDRRPAALPRERNIPDQIPEVASKVISNFK